MSYQIKFNGCDYVLINEPVAENSMSPSGKTIVIYVARAVAKSDYSADKTERDYIDSDIQLYDAAWDIDEKHLARQDYNRDEGTACDWSRPASIKKV